MTEAGGRHVAIIVAIGEKHIGVLVGAVSDIVTVAPESTRPPSGGEDLDAVA